MSWLTSLRDQLPLLLVLSPVIGFLVTYAASRFEPDAVRYLAISNACCTLLILGGLEWQFESSLAMDAATVRLAEHENAESGTESNSLDEIRRTLDRQRVETLRRQWFAIDGTNLFPALVLVVLTIVVVWRTDSSSNKESLFYPIVMLFEAASLGAMISYDVRALIMSSAASALAMSVLMGLWGTTQRRSHAERFLFAQFCGGAVIALGFTMLVVAVPWMKFQDSTTPPTVSWNIASIVQDIQKWTTRNELAFHYENEVFPWMLLVLSLGFAIQSGLFPFHSWQIGVVGDSPPTIAVLYLAGSLSACRVGWLRFVMPLAPDLLAAFDWLMLIPSLAGAVWGALRALAPGEPRQRTAFVLMSLSAISLLGCYSFTRIGMSGTWLMQQQLTIIFCAVLLAFEIEFSTRTLLLLICLPALGLFASGFVIVSELLHENPFLVVGVFIVGLLIAFTILSAIDRHFTREQKVASEASDANRLRGPLIAVLLLNAVVNLFPSLLLHQCEPEFLRVFHRFERSTSADSAEPSSGERQPAP